MSLGKCLHAEGQRHGLSACSDGRGGEAGLRGGGLRGVPGLGLAEDLSRLADGVEPGVELTVCRGHLAELGYRSDELGLGQCLDMHERADEIRSEEHTSELQSLMRTTYAVFYLKETIAC